MNTDVGTLEGNHPSLIELIDYRDGDLVESRSAVIESHLTSCSVCAEAMDAIAVDEFGDISPDLPEPFALPLKLTELLGEVPDGEPAPGELWLLEWDGIAMLGVVAGPAGGSHLWRVAPVTIEGPADTGDLAVVESDESPIGVRLHVWASAEQSFDHGVFLRRSAQLPGVLSLLAEFSNRTPKSWDAVMLLAELAGSSDVLVSAKWLVESSPRDSVADLMQARELRPTDVAAATGIAASVVRDIARGVRVPSASEAERLARVLGVGTDTLSIVPEPPSALVEAVSQPRWRHLIRVRALRDGITEAAARWSVATGVLALPARTSQGERDVTAWNALLGQYLHDE